MTKNPFGQVSRLSLQADWNGRATYIKELSFTAPYKIMEPFRLDSEGLQIMLLTASAGILEGDRQELAIQVERGAKLELLSQSYEKIHQMKEGHGERKTTIRIAGGGRFRYCPQPTIPFGDSAFTSTMKVELEDESAIFQMGEILSCGRYARGERFAYRYYHNLVEIFRDGHRIYRDNSRYEPQRIPMESLGMYEGYTHLSNVFISRPGPEFAGKVMELLREREGVEGAATWLAQGDCAVRIFAYRAQVLEELNREIFGMSAF